jgi:hypothetical protein
MTTLPEYLEARERLAKDLADDERIYPGRSFVLIYRDDLRTLLAGPPVSREDVARVIDPTSWGCWDEVRPINYGGHCLNEEPLGRVDDPTCKRWAHASYNDQLPQSLAKADAIAALYRGETK